MSINAYNEELIITFRKKVIYKNIHIFIERVQIYNVVLNKSIFKNLKSYFKNDVFN